jgi:hypothetical protein
MMKTETLKNCGGEITYSQDERLVSLAEKWLLEYFSDGIERSPTILEEDFTGQDSVGSLLHVQYYGKMPWYGTPFFPALARLVDRGEIIHRLDEDGNNWYKINTQNVSTNTWK